jgi:hypothetical protein
MAWVKYNLIGALMYGVAAAGTFNWITYAMIPNQTYGPPALLYVALVGSVVLGIGCILSIFTKRYGAIVGSVGAAISWIYFAPFAWLLQWGKYRWLFSIDLPWIIGNHILDLYQPVAVLLLVVATVYSVSRRWLWKPLSKNN